MSPTDAASSACYVVSTSTLAERPASQLYFAALLGQRLLVGARLSLALRRLRTIAGPAEFDHVRVARYPSPRSLAALRCSPLLLALDGVRRRGVSDLRMSLAAVGEAPADWREVRAAWVLTDRDHDRARSLAEILAKHPQLGGFCALEASLGPLPPHPLTDTVPPPLPASALSVLAFPSVRLALDALALPEVAPFTQPGEGPLGGSASWGWALMERVSLREMLTPG